MAKRFPKLVPILLVVLALTIIMTLVGMRKEGFEEQTQDLYVAASQVQGVGVFTGRGFKKDETVMTAVEPEKKITALGSKVNHCVSRANVVLREAEPGYWNLYAKRDLEKGEEVLADYHDTPDFIKKPDPSWTC
jgi:hypothetical protein